MSIHILNNKNIENTFNYFLQRRLVERDFFLNTRLADFLYLREGRRRREPPILSDVNFRCRCDRVGVVLVFKTCVGGEVCSSGPRFS